MGTSLVLDIKKMLCVLQVFKLGGSHTENYDVENHLCLAEDHHQIEVLDVFEI